MHLPYLTGLDSLVPRWKDVGDRLGVPASELDAIQENNRGSLRMHQNCLREMFLWWLRNGEDVTARKLSKVSHEIGEHTAESRINFNFGEWRFSLVY